MDKEREVTILTEDDLFPVIFAEGFCTSSRFPLEQTSAAFGREVLLVTHTLLLL